MKKRQGSFQAKHTFILLLNPSRTNRTYFYLVTHPFLEKFKILLKNTDRMYRRLIRGGRGLHYRQIFSSRSCIRGEGTLRILLFPNYALLNKANGIIIIDVLNIDKDRNAPSKLIPETNIQLLVCIKELHLKMMILSLYYYQQVLLSITWLSRKCI